MRKVCLLLFICSFSFVNQAQDLSYGLLLGGTSYSVKTDDIVVSSEGVGYSINIGGFLDYQLSERFGIKSNLLYASAVEDNYRFKGALVSELFDLKLSTIQLIPHLKFNLGKDYKNGLYLLVGPRLSLLLNEKDDDGNKIDGFYSTTSLGAQFGFGINLLKHFALEILGDLAINDVLEIEPGSRQRGAYLTLDVDLESLLNN